MPPAAADAESMGAAMRAAGYIPASRALLHRQARPRDARWFARHTGIDGAPRHLPDSLYSEDAAGYLDFIRDNGGRRPRCSSSATIR